MAVCRTWRAGGAVIAIQWEQLSQAKFDEIVDALLSRLFDGPGAQVRAYDGWGGDGGIDVLVRQGGRLRVFQL